MKKHLTTLFLFAATMLVTLMFTACGEEVNIDEGGQPPVRLTEFITDGDATRTTIDKDRFFYWTKNDKVFIDNGTEWVMSTESDITGRTAKAIFEVPGSFSGLTYPVRYTGYQKATGTPADTMNTSYDKVVIAHEQTQSAWSNGDHLAYSGDCGLATARKQPNGKYRFQLEHQASYLFFYPYLNSKLSGNYTLQKIDIYSDVSASNIAGTYDFGTNGLLDANGLPLTPQSGTGKQQITLTCNGGFGLLQTVPNLTSTDTFNHCVVVIAPGSHELTVIYTVKDASNNTLEFVQDISMTEFIPNGVYPYIHELEDAVTYLGQEFNEANLLYRWGRTYDSYGTQTADYDTSTSQATNGFWSQALTTASITHYVESGIFYDNAIKWRYNRRDGTQTEHRGGWWFKKSTYIPGFNRTTMTASGRNWGTTIKGRPATNVIGQYFLIPRISTTTNCWTNNPNSTILAWVFTLKPSDFSTSVVAKNNAYIAGLRPDGTAWFQ